MDGREKRQTGAGSRQRRLRGAGRTWTTTVTGAVPADPARLVLEPCPNPSARDPPMRTKVLLLPCPSFLKSQGRKRSPQKDVESERSSSGPSISWVSVVPRLPPQHPSQTAPLPNQLLLRRHRGRVVVPIGTGPVSQSRPSRAAGGMGRAHVPPYGVTTLSLLPTSTGACRLPRGHVGSHPHLRKHRLHSHRHVTPGRKRRTATADWRSMARHIRKRATRCAMKGTPGTRAVAREMLPATLTRLRRPLFHTEEDVTTLRRIPNPSSQEK